MTFLQYTANPFQQKSSVQANDLFINMCLEKESITKSYQGKCKKAPLKFEIPIRCVVFNETKMSYWQVTTAEGSLSLQ